MDIERRPLHLIESCTEHFRAGIFPAAQFSAISDGQFFQSLFDGHSAGIQFVGHSVPQIGKIQCPTFAFDNLSGL